MKTTKTVNFEKLAAQLDSVKADVNQGSLSETQNTFAALLFASECLNGVAEFY